jgi:hypothetical protein
MTELKSFEHYKAAKLKRMKSLRLMNAVGMVAWRKDADGDAKQHLRLLHPLTWIWIILVVLFSIVMQGIPSTIDDFCSTWKEDTLIW